MTVDILALANQAAATGPDMTQASKGGEGYTPPAAGPTMGRLVGYIELGDHERSIGQGKPKVFKPVARLIFELIGPKHPAREKDGVVHPVTITEDINAAPGFGPLNEKATLYKVFKRMNYDGTAKHMSQLLGRPYLLNVNHRKVGEGEAAKVFAGLRGESGFDISPPKQMILDPLTGEAKENILSCDPARSPLRLFLWNAAPDVIGALWDSIFIDGEWPARTDDAGKIVTPAKSKNVIQQHIGTARNFAGSPIDQYLKTKGVKLELGAAEPQAPASQPQVNAPSDDPLAGVN